MGFIKTTQYQIDRLIVGIAKRKAGGVDVSFILSLWVPAIYLRVSDNISNIYTFMIETHEYGK